MQQDKLRDFLKFFRFHLPWFVLSAGFFAVILLSGVFFSSRLTNLRGGEFQSQPSQEVALSVPETKLPVESPQITEPARPEAPAAPTPVVAPSIAPTPKATPVMTAKPTPVATPVVSPLPTPTPQPLQDNKPITKEPSQVTGSYVVKSGDTLWDISVKTYGSGYDYSRISRENKLVNPDKLVIGQKLVLPAKSVQGKIASGVSIDHGDSTVTAGAYKIVKGDSLWKIAEQQLGDPYRWTEIYQLNKATIGNNPDLIYPDVALKMPANSSGAGVSNSSSSSTSDSSPNWTSSLLQ